MWLHLQFNIVCFCGSASETLACGMYQSEIWSMISSCTGRLLPNGARGVQVYSLRQASLSRATKQLIPMPRGCRPFICHAGCHLQVLPTNHSLLCRLEPFAISNAESTATGRIGRVCDSITPQCEGIGFLKRWRAAQQRQRFWHLSTWLTKISGPKIQVGGAM